jgi:hypothetical protein
VHRYTRSHERKHTFASGALSSPLPLLSEAYEPPALLNSCAAVSRNAKSHMQQRRLHTITPARSAVRSRTRRRLTRTRPA